MYRHAASQPRPGGGSLTRATPGPLQHAWPPALTPHAEAAHAALCLPELTQRTAAVQLPADDEGNVHSLSYYVPTLVIDADRSAVVLGMRA